MYVLVRTLVFMYVHQLVSVKWGNSLSSEFSISNGVKQGGVLSPVLFSIYIDNLFVQLKHSGLGCHLGSTFAGTFGYADDVILLTPTVYSLNHLYQQCNEHCNEYDIKLNPEKSKLIAYNSNISGIYLGNNYIRCHTYEKHLGNSIGPNVVDKDIRSNITEMFVYTNHIISLFGKASYEVKYQLFKTYCMPLYGSVLWDYSQSSIEQLFVNWRKCVWKLINIPYHTHSALLPLICNVLPVDCQMHKIVLTFIYCLNKSCNLYNKISLQLPINGSQSRMCNTINYVSYKYNIGK